MAVELEPSWLQVLGLEFEKPYMADLKKFLKEEKESGVTVYPKGSDIFNAFWKTPFTNVKVVILGQDPYPGQTRPMAYLFPFRKYCRPCLWLISIKNYRPIYLGLKCRHMATWRNGPARVFYC